MRGNGLPPAGAMLPREQTAAHLQAMFAGSGELRLNGAIPAHWQVSLPVSIDYP
ncbi:hypothetical protein [Edwardsiella hoshinae]|uniref:F4 family fimbrial subunit n=1 Tax=Edwardsiella hoshinae TaxID=93378 RepID=UPI000B0CA16E|nr:hypothetical protein [Edwardsiella hoshinae]